MIDDSNNLPYYLVALSIPDDEIDKLENVELKPGMPAEVAIKTGERTALSYLVKPFTDGIARAFKDG